MNSILKQWNEENGLVTKQLAADICGVTNQSIVGAVGRGKIKAIVIGNKEYLSMKDVLFYKAQRESY